MGKLTFFINKNYNEFSQQFSINNNPNNHKFMKLKNFNRLLFFVFILLFVAQSCVKQGPMGLTGAAGTNGTNGIDANSSCLPCHNTAMMTEKTLEYQLSKHFFGTTSTSRNTKYCARCHTSDGFMEIVADGLFVCNNDIPAAERINCQTCHTMSAFDFSGDTASYILRTTTPVYLNYYNNTRTEDFGKVDNLCCTCHQIRGATVVKVYLKKADGVTDSTATKSFTQLPFFPFDNSSKTATDMATLVDFKVGQSFAVHDGNQSNLFKGINGFEYPGKTYTRTWQHSLEGGAIPFNCTSCHMNTVGQGMNAKIPNPDGTVGRITTIGGHTLVPNTAVCATCHTSDHLAATQNAVNGLLMQLANRLVAHKLFKPALSGTTFVPFDPVGGTGTPSAIQAQDFYGAVLPTTPGSTLYGLTLASANSITPGPSPSASLNETYVSSVTMSKDVASNATYRKGSKWTYGELGAAYNFGFIMSELSQGIHNPTYAQQILQTSIDYLDGK